MRFRISKKLFIAIIVGIIVGFTAFVCEAKQKDKGIDPRIYDIIMCKETPSCNRVNVQTPVVAARKNVFKDPTPKQEENALDIKDGKLHPIPKPDKEGEVMKPYEFKVYNKDKFKPGYVYYAKKNVWIALHSVPAIERTKNEMHLYYPNTDKVFKVVFRTEQDAIAATNIVLNGFDAELPPYFVEE